MDVVYGMARLLLDADLSIGKCGKQLLRADGCQLTERQAAAGAGKPHGR